MSNQNNQKIVLRKRGKCDRCEKDNQMLRIWSPKTLVHPKVKEIYYICNNCAKICNEGNH